MILTQLLEEAFRNHLLVLYLNLARVELRLQEHGEVQESSLVLALNCSQSFFEDLYEVERNHLAELLKFSFEF